MIKSAELIKMVVGAAYTIFQISKFKWPAIGLIVFVLESNTLVLSVKIDFNLN